MEAKKAMSIREVSDIVHKYTEESVIISTIKIGLLCTVCGHEWLVRVDDEQELIRQAGKFICMPCYHDRLDKKAKKVVKYEQRHSNG